MRKVKIHLDENNFTKSGLMVNNMNLFDGSTEQKEIEEAYFIRKHKIVDDFESKTTKELNMIVTFTEGCCENFVSLEDYEFEFLEDEVDYVKEIEELKKTIDFKEQVISDLSSVNKRVDKPIEFTPPVTEKTVNENDDVEWYKGAIIKLIDKL